MSFPLGILAQIALLTLEDFLPRLRRSLLNDIPRRHKQVRVTAVDEDNCITANWRHQAITLTAFADQNGVRPERMECLQRFVSASTGLLA